MLPHNPGGHDCTLLPASQRTQSMGAGQMFINWFPSLEIETLHRPFTWRSQKMRMKQPNFIGHMVKWRDMREGNEDTGTEKQTKEMLQS